MMSSLLLLSMLLGCATAGKKLDPQAYGQAMSEREAYKSALETSIVQIPKLRQEIAALSKEHLALSAKQGSKMSEDDHRKMVAAESAKLADEPVALPPSPKAVDLDAMDEQQQTEMLAIDQDIKQIETQLPLLSESNKDRQWLQTDIARLKQGAK